MSPDTLREWRTAKGMTQKQLAELAGVTTRAVKHWEAGTRPIPKLLALYITQNP